MTEQTCPTCKGDEWHYTGRGFDVEPCPDCTGRKEFVAAPGTSHIIPRDPVTGEVDELRCAQESTDAAISDYNDALARIATLETALERIRDNPAGADIVAQYALSQQEK